MSESVDILIKAEDMATPVVAKSAKSVDALDASIKRIKTSGEQAKKSTEFFGSIANALGGSEIGSYASQLAGLTEKTSQFAEVQKLGGAGALAFKAGLAAAAGALAFQVGTAIGNVIFETEKWTKKLAEATAESDRLINALTGLKDFQFSQNKEEISLIRDPDEQLAATKKLLADTQKEIEDKSKQITAILKAEAKTRFKEEQFGDDWFGAGADRIASVEKEVAAGNKVLETLRKQATELERATSQRALENKEIAKKNALQDKSDDYLKGLREEVALLRASKEEQAGILASRTAIGDIAQQEAKALLVEKDKIAKQEEEKKNAEALVKSSADYVQSLREQVALLAASDNARAGVEAGQKTLGGDTAIATQLLKEKELLTEKREKEKKDIAEKEATTKRLTDLKQSELNKLEEERILLTQGKEAAHAFALEKQGLNASDAKEIAGKAQQNQNLKVTATTNQAFESRLLRSGPSDDAAKMTAQNTANAAAALKRIEMIADREEKERTRQKGRITNFTVVS